MDAARNAGAFASGLFQPTIRLGVTGLARSGKTVFLTSLVANLVARSRRLPFFGPEADGRLIRAYLEPQPNDDVPRFAYETHMAALTGDPPQWPESTSRISQLRLTLEYQPEGFLKRTLRRNKIHIDLVDYPGEWLLDLPLLGKSFAEWSAETIAHAEQPERVKLAQKWLTLTRMIDPDGDQDEAAATGASDAFKAYLAALRKEPNALSTIPPGRFLMPGDLAGSPALTFAPLALSEETRPPRGSLGAMMERRYESYKAHVVKPFFRDHFVRLDRQIVLVDALTALNAGPAALHELERSMASILACFRPGANSWLSTILRRRIDRIVFAATKADHLHHTSHDRLEAILGKLTERAIDRAAHAGADVKVLAMAALRATREAEVKQGRASLPCILGRPLPGEQLDGETFDGTEEIAIFPGDLPEDPDAAIARGRPAPSKTDEDMRFIRFMPPEPNGETGSATSPVFPHIRLDRALDFLLGDRLS